MKLYPELLTAAELSAQADDYLAFAKQNNLEPQQKERLRRAATAMIRVAETIEPR